MDPKGIRELLRAIYAYRGHPATEAALKLAPLVFVRAGELRKAEWSELDLDGGEWRIPAHKNEVTGTAHRAACEANRRNSS
jgi:integrase